MSREIKSAHTRVRVQTVIDKDAPTRAVQSEAKHADINNIVAKAFKTGQLPVLMNRQHIPDLPDALTYQDMLNKVVFAQQQFERLPSAVRAQFANKPENMLAAVEASKSDEKTYQALAELGIVNPKEPVISAEAPAEAPA